MPLTNPFSSVHLTLPTTVLILLPSQVSLWLRSHPKSGSAGLRGHAQTLCAAARESTEIPIQSSIHPDPASLRQAAPQTHSSQLLSILVRSRRQVQTPVLLYIRTLSVTSLKGNKENAFQIFLISVISCTHPVTLQGLVPQLNFRIASQPVITRTRPLCFQDWSSLRWKSVCGAYKYSATRSL